jgi:hypothetical protein
MRCYMLFYLVLRTNLVLAPAPLPRRLPGGSPPQAGQVQRPNSPSAHGRGVWFLSPEGAVASKECRNCGWGESSRSW